MPAVDATSPARRRIRVLVVVGSLDVGGVEMDILRNFPRLDREWFDVRVYAFMEPGELAPRLAHEGIELVLSPKAPQLRRANLASREGHALDHVPGLRTARRAFHHASQLARAAWPLRRYIAANRIEIVHCFLPFAYIVGAAATLTMPRCRLVMSRVSSSFYMDVLPHYRLAETWFAHRRLDAAVCNAASIKQELTEEGIAESRITIIRNGIDFDSFVVDEQRRSGCRAELGLNADQLVFTCVANLHPYKGHADMIDAFALIAARLPTGWRLLCAGRDVDDTRVGLERQVAEKGLSHNIRFLGSVSDVPGLLAASDLHLHPSREDAFPNSVLEAMAAGLPIVATNVGGIPELVVSGSGGLLVSPQSPTELGEAIMHVAEDPLLRRSMGEANHRRANERFSITASVRAYEDLYMRLTGLAGRSMACCERCN
ncbi:MAG: glycosyltransferase [Hyphomicrobiaceae bacterium]